MKYLLLALALTGSVSARIGETFDQCAARYGDLVERGPGGGAERGVFTTGMFRVQCDFWDGKCVFLAFEKIRSYKVDSSLGEKTPFLSQEQADQILAASGGARKWVKIPGDGPFDNYKTEDGSLFATMSLKGFGPSIYLQSKADIDRRSALMTPGAIAETLKRF